MIIHLTSNLNDYSGLLLKLAHFTFIFVSQYVSIEFYKWQLIEQISLLATMSS